MRLLLDTHAFLWWIFDNPKLPLSARARISDPTADVFFSTVSAWEIAIKAGTGRLALPANVAGFVTQQVRANDFLTLPIQLEHALAVHGLPAIHQDPFDRLLAAQAQVERLTLLTCDQLVQRYPIETVW